METQTRFDLNAAIANWKQEIAVKAELTEVVRCELETHLRDTLAELQARGLNNEEAFWLARRRLGEPQLLSQEFEKADPVGPWRDRVFWMSSGLLAIYLWTGFLNQLILFWQYQNFSGDRLEDILPLSILFYLPNWLRIYHISDALQIVSQLARFAPFVVFAFFLARGRLKFGQGALSYILASRGRFILAAFGAFLICYSPVLFNPAPGRIRAIFFFQIPWMLSLIALATWQFPVKKRIAAKN